MAAGEEDTQELTLSSGSALKLTLCCPALTKGLPYSDVRVMPRSLEMLPTVISSKQPPLKPTVSLKWMLCKMKGKTAQLKT